MMRGGEREEETVYLKQKSSPKSTNRGRGERLWETQRTILFAWDQKLRIQKCVLGHLWKRQIVKDESREEDELQRVSLWDLSRKVFSNKTYFVFPSHKKNIKRAKIDYVAP